MAVLDKWKLFAHPKVGWEPHDSQKLICQSTARHKVVVAGRRFGKSEMAGVDKLLPEIFFTRPLANQLVSEGKRRTFWIVGGSYSDSEKEFRVIWDLCKRLEIPMEKGSHYHPEMGLMQIILWGGAMHIVAKSSQVPERLVGESLCGVIMSEAAKMKPNIWPKYIRPMLADFQGWSLHVSTPEGKNHLYDIWRSAKDPANKSWESWQMPAWRNHFVYRTTTLDDHVDKLLALKRSTYENTHRLAADNNLTIDPEVIDSVAELSSELFQQEIAASFTDFTGRVFKDFDEEVHVTDLVYEPSWDTVAGMDAGFSNPAVFLLIQIGPWGEINVINEVYEEGLDPEMFAAEIDYRGLNPAPLRMLYPDPADPGFAHIVARKLSVKLGSSTGGPLNNRLNWIRKALRDPRVVISRDPSGLEEGSKRPRLLFDRKCKRTIEDMLAYRYPELRTDGQRLSASGGELPMKKDDHGPEALGRFFAGYFGSPVKPYTNARIYDADFSNEDKPQSASREVWRRPASAERNRTVFPKRNALQDYLEGHYEEKATV